MNSYVTSRGVVCQPRHKKRLHCVNCCCLYGVRN